MMHRLIVIARCAKEHFPDIISEAPVIFSDRLGQFSMGKLGQF